MDKEVPVRPSWSSYVEEMTLTVRPSWSSYGVPVLLIDGEVFGPADFVPSAHMTASQLLRVWVDRFGLSVGVNTEG